LEGIMAVIENQEPIKINKGNTVKWNKSFPDYPTNDGWELNYTLSSSDGTEIDTLDFDDHISVTNNEFNVVIPASDTASYSGILLYEGTVTKDFEVYTVSSGFFKIIDKNEFIETLDHIKTTLDAINTMIEGKATKDVESYSIYGRSLSKMNIKELLDWQGIYEDKLSRLMNKNSQKQGKGSKNLIKVRF
jgi:hypothetical protein